MLGNLINAINREQYDVSLLLVSRTKGPYASLLPKDITIIEKELLSKVGSIGGITYLLRKGHFILFIGTLLRLFLALFNKSWSAYIMSRLMPSIGGDYDLIVDYNGQQQTYYMVDKLKGKKKVAFFHSDYAKWPFYYEMDKRYYPKLDAIFTISPSCVMSLKKYFPSQSNKIKLMENITSQKIIEKMSEEAIDLPRKSQWSFLTVGHVCKNKGTDLAIRAGKILKEKGVDFTWYFIGNKSELHLFMPLVEELGLNENFVFLGLKTNPYPYFRVCDMVVHPSLFEGKSVTLDEAKLLHKPIVVTNFSTVNDQFINGVNANIVELNPESIARGIYDLIANEQVRINYVSWLKQNCRDNVKEVEKIYKLLD